MCSITILISILKAYNSQRYLDMIYFPYINFTLKTIDYTYRIIFTTLGKNFWEVIA